MDFDLSLSLSLSLSLAHQHLISFAYPFERIYGFWHVCMHAIINILNDEIHVCVKIFYTTEKGLH